ncbi:MAG TPA: Hpt domain-containing protein, partial [Burkholderiaceae bacterium]|nr:Hpt domain-containing protein [Burkholderiaceae bacterium]
ESQDETDRELHDIFVEEAQEVLGTIESHLGALRDAPSNTATLTSVRRAFHTLKGSSRMVGLKQFGEGAWAIEQCFNLWLAQERPATDDLIELAGAAHRLMRDWIAVIQTNPKAAIDVAALVQAAQRVREGAPFEFQSQARPSKSPGSAAEQAPPALPEEVGGARQASHEVAADGDGESGDDNLKRIGPVEISRGLYAVFLTEADECIRTLAQDFAEWRFEPARPVTMNTVRCAHSLAGISATVGLTPVWHLADPLDDLVHELARRQETGAPMLTEAQFGRLEATVNRMRGMLHQFAAGAFPDAAAEDAAALLVLLRDVQRQGLPHAPVAVPANDVAYAAPAPAEKPAPAGAASVDMPAADVPRVAMPVEDAALTEEITLEAAAATAVDDISFDDGLVEDRLNEEAIVVSALPEEATPPESPVAFAAPPEEAPRAESSAAFAAPATRDDVAETFRRTLEPALTPSFESAPAPGSETTPAPAFGAAPASAFKHAVAPGERSTLPPLQAPRLIEPEPVGGEPAAAAAEEAAAPLFLSTVRDELDADLLPVFVNEAHDLLPAIGKGLRALATNPNDHGIARELMRHLHTLKGSARMAGAMRLGEVVHDMETRIESAMQLVSVPPVIVEDLQSQYDQALHVFDQVTGKAPMPPVAQPAAVTEAEEAPGTSDMAPVIDLAAARAAEARAAAPAASLPLSGAAPATPAAPVPQTASFIRVRADVLDKLVDQAGEVSIARSKLENEVGTLKGALLDLTENIGRLRTQLREVEIQADAQIQARADQLAKESAAFDPLEFDRYTRLQELTRMLAESVEDVAMVQSNMLKGLQMADTDLTSQSRLTRELQQQLMRVRLVPFQNVAERLYRVARQTAKELDKRVNLEIVGGSTEIDRGVLERMGGPFEHLVRNAIVHGLESPAQRLAAGKRETGELTIEVRQEGNEIVVVVADDGGGLDLARIRERGIEKGIVGATQVVSDRELMELIFAPGFSTAAEVTELAGRGVGMDVVRAELSSFGGRVAVASDAGQGTRFTLYLPLTLAVTQVVLVTVGTRRYAIPAGMVEQVRRYKPAQLLPALGEGTINLAPIGEVVLRPLAQLLGVEVVPHHGKQAPIVLLRSGDDRLAIAVDDLSSNQEVVVKNVGAQVSRLAGILGATILGDGEIVLILNPVQLITHAPEPPTIFSEPHAQPAATAPSADRRHESERLEGPPVIMVVDDSLTVRRVTQRLLERNGFDVLLAKDGVDALRQLQDVKPDAMLVDIEMPRMDGFDLTRNVRSASTTRDVPILMITSRTAEKHRSMALSIGVNEYLGKPYQEEELLGLLRKYIAARAVA